MHQPWWQCSWKKNKSPCVLWVRLPKAISASRKTHARGKSWSCTSNYFLFYIWQLTMNFSTTCCLKLSWRNHQVRDSSRASTLRAGPGHKKAFRKAQSSNRRCQAFLLPLGHMLRGRRWSSVPQDEDAAISTTLHGAGAHPSLHVLGLKRANT